MPTLAAFPVVQDEAPKAADDEMAPHAFNSRTRYEPGDDRDIWCKDCEYHRDHDIHKPSLGASRPSPADRKPPIGRAYIEVKAELNRLAASAASAEAGKDPR